MSRINMVGIIISFLILPNFLIKAEKKKKVIYKYKKYQKFDFDSFSIKGEEGSPGDLSAHLRKITRFKNMLPYRKNFYPEMKKSIERVR